MINIDTVYQKVLALANKEQRGYITPQEFNILADKAQLDLVNNYFHSVKTAYHKVKNQTEGSDEADMVNEKLDYLRTTTDVRAKLSSSGNAIVTLPSNLYKIATIYLKTNGYTQSTSGGVTTSSDTDVSPFVEVSRINRKDLININSNPLMQPNIARPVYISEYDSSQIKSDKFRIELHPSAKYTSTSHSSITLDGESLSDQTTHVLTNSSDTGIKAEVYHEGTDTGLIESGGGHMVQTPGAKIAFDYWKKPTKPYWGYVVVSSKALYNTNTSTNFELHPMEEENLVTRILELAGLTIEEIELSRMAGADKANTMKIQNV